MSHSLCSCIIFALLATVAARVNAENWPGWRGPRSDGTSSENRVPLRWNGQALAERGTEQALAERGTENVLWKRPIPGTGHASPIVWEDRVFVVTCRQDTQERLLICLERRSGKPLWQQVVVRSPLERKHQLNSFASGTPATDGELVYVAFLEAGNGTTPAKNVSQPRPMSPSKVVVAAYDFAGKQKWLVRPGDFSSIHGFCSCPVLFEDLVIVNGDHDGESYIVALKRATGETVWKVPREHKTRSYVTPLIRDIDGRTQMVLSGSKSITSYDPRTGKLHWNIDGPTEQFVASMVFDGKLFFMSAGYPTYHVMAIRPDGQGNVTNSHVAWHVTTAKCYVPSPVVVGRYLLVADDRGTANCFDTSTGDRLWQERLGNHYSASLVTAGGLVYFLADDGITKIVRPGAKLEVVAENQLGEYCYASPAISGGQLFIRGEMNLYCIGRETSDK